MNERTTPDDLDRATGLVFLAVATLAVFAGLGIAPALRGAAMGLDGVIDRVDRAAAVLSQGAVLLAVVLGTTRALPFVLNVRPWPIALSALLGGLGCSLLGIAASRSMLPEMLVLGGAAFLGCGLALFGALARVRVSLRVVASAFSLLLLAESAPRLLALFFGEALLGGRLSLLTLPLAQLASAILVGAALVVGTRGHRSPFTTALLLVGALLGALLARRTHPGLVWSFAHTLLTSLGETSALPPALTGAALVSSTVITLAAVGRADGYRGFLGFVALVALAPKSPLSLLLGSTALVLFGGSAESRLGGERAGAAE